MGVVVLVGCGNCPGKLFLATCQGSVMAPESFATPTETDFLFHRSAPLSADWSGHWHLRSDLFHPNQELHGHIAEAVGVSGSSNCGWTKSVSHLGNTKQKKASHSFNSVAGFRPSTAMFLVASCGLSKALAYQEALGSLDWWKLDLELNAWFL